MMGNASKLDPRAAASEFGRLLAQGEQLHAAYQLVRDSFLFTDRRLILVDKQGMTGKMVEYHSVPYRAITQFSVETAGHFDLDAELTPRGRPARSRFRRSRPRCSPGPRATRR